jgi:hypothetical protein
VPGVTLHILHAQLLSSYLQEKTLYILGKLEHFIHFKVRDSSSVLGGQPRPEEKLKFPVSGDG